MQVNLIRRSLFMVYWWKGKLCTVGRLQHVRDTLGPALRVWVGPAALQDCAVSDANLFLNWVIILRIMKEMESVLSIWV